MNAAIDKRKLSKVRNCFPILLSFLYLAAAGKSSGYASFFFRAVLEGLKPTTCLKMREK